MAAYLSHLSRFFSNISNLYISIKGDDYAESIFIYYNDFIQL